MRARQELGWTQKELAVVRLFPIMSSFAESQRKTSNSGRVRTGQSSPESANFGKTRKGIGCEAAWERHWNAFGSSWFQKVIKLMFAVVMGVSAADSLCSPVCHVIGRERLLQS